VPPAAEPAPAPAAAAPVGLALAALRDALLPSEREMAVNQLSKCDWRSNAPVVQALVAAAREDPAPSVRAACVRSLAKMHVNTIEVLATLQALDTDNDPRVQQEVKQAMQVLASSLTSPVTPGLQPAAASAPSAPAP
jgi:hypothetical protein